MSIPADGYSPDRAVYEVHYPWAPEHAVVTLDVTMTEQTNMSVEEADQLVREHLEALFVSVRAAAGEPDLRLIRTYRGARVDDVTPGEAP